MSLKCHVIHEVGLLVIVQNHTERLIKNTFISIPLDHLRVDIH